MYWNTIRAGFMVVGFLSIAGCAKTFPAPAIERASGFVPAYDLEMEPTGPIQRPANCHLWMRVYTDDGKLGDYSDNFTFSESACIKYEGKPVAMPNELRIYTTRSANGNEARAIKPDLYCANMDDSKSCKWNLNFIHGIPWTIELSTYSFKVDPKTGMPSLVPPEAAQPNAAPVSLKDVVDLVRVVRNGVDVFDWTPGMPLKDLPSGNNGIHVEGDPAGSPRTNDHTLIIPGSDLAANYMPHLSDIGLYVAAKDLAKPSSDGAKAAQEVEKQSKADSKMAAVVAGLQRLLIDAGQTSDYPYGELSCLQHQVQLISNKVLPDAGDPKAKEYFDFQDKVSGADIADQPIDTSLKTLTTDIEKHIAQLAVGKYVLVMAQQKGTKTSANDNGIYEVVKQDNKITLKRSERWVTDGKLTDDNFAASRDVTLEGGRRFRLRPVKGEIGKIPLVFDPFDCPKDSLKAVLDASDVPQSDAIAKILEAGITKIKDPKIQSAIQTQISMLSFVIKDVTLFPDAFNKLKENLAKAETQQRIYINLASQAKNVDTMFPQRQPNPLPNVGEGVLKMHYYDKFQHYFFGTWNGVAVPVANDVIKGDFKVDNLIPIIDLYGARWQGSWSRFADFRMGFGVLGARESKVNDQGNEQYTDFRVGLQASVSLLNVRLGIGMMLNEPDENQGLEGNVRVLVGADLIKILTGRPLEAGSSSESN